MKKTQRKLKLNAETLKLLATGELPSVVGGGPVTTRDLPCIPRTARDCE